MITGLSGLIGKHLVEQAKERGHEVVEFDIKNGLDILNKEQIAQAINGCSAVIHLAAAVAPQKQFGLELSNNYQVNIAGFLNVIEAAREHGINKFVYASSSAVYGRFGNADGPFREDARIDYTKEENYYGKTKMVNEMIAASYHDAFGMNCIGLRIISAFGAGDLERNDGGPIIAHFIKQHLDGKPLEVFGDGSTARDYIHVIDCANMALDLLDNAPSNVYNIASGKVVTVNEITEVLGGEVIHKPNPNSYAYPVVQADMTRTFKAIGERP